MKKKFVLVAVALVLALAFTLPVASATPLETICEAKAELRIEIAADVVEAAEDILIRWDVECEDNWTFICDAQEELQKAEDADDCRDASRYAARSIIYSIRAVLKPCDVE